MQHTPKHDIHIDSVSLAEIIFPEGSLGQPAAAQVTARKTADRVNSRQGGSGESEPVITLCFESEYVRLFVSCSVDNQYVDDYLTHLEMLQNCKDIPASPSVTHRRALHLSGWLYAKRHKLDSLSLDLVYCTRDDEEKVFREICTTEALCDEYEAPVLAQLEWYSRNEAHNQELCARLRDFQFPYEGFRRGQYDLSKAVYRALRDGKILFAEAPTGTGKTAAVLYPALKARAQGLCGKIFYLTAKNSGAASAEKTAALFNAAGAGFRWIRITAKSRICFTNDSESARPQCSPQNCPYAHDYFTRRNAALEEIFTITDFSRDTIEALARRHTLCPFELSLDLALFCDLIICDYNHVFDPHSKLKRFFENGDTSHALLIDEAHNMIDRARAMFSSTLDKKQIMTHKKSQYPPLKKAMTELNKAFLALGRDYENEAICELTPPEEFIKAAQKCRRKIEQLLDKGASLTDAELQFYFELLSFTAAAERYSDSYRCVIKKSKTGISLSLRCIDTAQEIEAVLSRQKAAVFFSATLSPAPYYFSLLAPSLAPRSLSLESPFDASHCLHFLRSDLSTRYNRRGENLNAYANLVAAIIENIKGNIVIFSPSFKFQNDLIDALDIDKRGDTGRLGQIIVQDAAFSARDRDEFVETFHTCANLKAFCVCGGSFSESIDLPGERLIGVIVFGVGLPQIGFDNDTIKDYFQQKFSAGYQFAYQFPGFNKVLQAAGRVIRTQTDRGFVLLVDDRYRSPDYRRLIPPHWIVQSKADENTIIEKVNRLLSES